LSVSAPPNCVPLEIIRGRNTKLLLDAFIDEARRRGMRRIWVQSHDFQAPAFYEKAGFARMAEFPGWPDGHSNVIICKTLSDAAGRPA
jgi:N-acetylglutamate synthase-like GNAT family acetyltransferase